MSCPIPDSVALLVAVVACAAAIAVGLDRWGDDIEDTARGAASWAFRHAAKAAPKFGPMTRRPPRPPTGK